MQFKRWAQTDINDIEDPGRGEGGVLNKMGKKPLAVYKDEDGQVRTLRAICPHMMGVVCWNHAGKSWDCPVHGSRFSTDGVCVTGPAKSNLNPECHISRRTQEVAAGG
ncbi:Rieske [2Fe-2S] iron-sulfur domain-containing protein [Elsinoe ampelina]|uniref:Rieske [2Fe-2S] iron-sulfur domain-containing protein n=1 Tax=Elsinoe ampelina TaxID=302913 RepID=A0A6A6GC03_9PEZI|nr:Rieske [2Fe-2S] iron-sulfur domain-containing protein [Elsinoe ampelina]